MNEENEIIKEDMVENTEEITEGTENTADSLEDIPSDGSLEGGDLEIEEGFYDKLVKDIVDKLKENSGLEGEDVEVSDNDIVLDTEITDTTPEVLPVYLENDVSHNDIPVSDILDYLKEREINTSLGMPFGDALLSDLTVTDGLILVFLVIFLFRWLYDYGRSLF